MAKHLDVGLIDVDGRHFPNLALMKLSAFHKQQGDRVSFAVMGNYDIIYKSKVFTFSKDTEDNWIFAKEIKKGGTGYKMADTLDEEIEHILPDYDLYACEHAYGFLTRGCIRACKWCVVPTKEGMLRANADIDEFIGSKTTAILMDNNVLASPHGLQQIEKIIDKRISVDFNQGLDARIIVNNPEIASLLGRVKWLKPLRMACDTDGQIESIAKATELLRKAGAVPRAYFVYVLVQDIESALRRVIFLRSLKLDPFAQPYIDFEGGGADKRLKQFARWVNCRQLRNVSWTDYKYGEHYIRRKNV
jgi:hypothetical protein